MTNLTENQGFKNNPELENAIQNYLISHTAEDTSDHLNDLLQAWIVGDVSMLQNHRDIADMVFFVNNLAGLIRKLEAFNDKINLKGGVQCA